MHSQVTPAMRGLVALALSFALFAGMAAAASADVNPLWDHYKVYQVQPQPSFVVPVTLVDQFGVTSHNTQALQLFSNPVEKVHGTLVFPIHDPRLHYMWWKLTPEISINRTIVANNQFGEQTLVVDRAVYLLNPANKNEPSDTPLPVANHYKCYTCSGAPVNIPVFLTDQFYARPAQVFSPRFFCTPTVKIYAGVEDPILDREQHYVAYDIEPGTPIWQATMRDQFIQAGLSLTFDHLLLVPTDKVEPTPAGPSTWGRVKSQYR